MSDDLIIVSEPARRIFTITADNRLIWHEPMPAADPVVILAATDVVASQYGLVRRERLEAAEAKLAKAVEAMKMAVKMWQKSDNGDPNTRMDNCINAIVSIVPVLAELEGGGERDQKQGG